MMAWLFAYAGVFLCILMLAAIAAFWSLVMYGCTALLT